MSSNSENARARAMGTVVAVTAGAPGEGVTTTTAGLGLALASLGRRTCVIDLSGGERSLTAALDLDRRETSGLLDVLHGRSKISTAVLHHKRRKELYVLPAGGGRQGNPVGESDGSRLDGMLDAMRLRFDYLLCDLPAGAGDWSSVVLGKTETVVLVTRAEQAALDIASRRFDGIIRQLPLTGTYAGRLDQYLLVNAYDPGAPDGMEPLAASTAAGLPLVGVVPRTAAPVGAGAPSQSYIDAARRLEGEFVPFDEDPVEQSVEDDIESTRTALSTRVVDLLASLLYRQRRPDWRGNGS